MIEIYKGSLDIFLDNSIDDLKQEILKSESYVKERPEKFKRIKNYNDFEFQIKRIEQLKLVLDFKLNKISESKFYNTIHLIK